MISSKQDHHEANLAKAHENKYSLQDHYSSNARSVTLILIHNHCSLNAAKLVSLNGIKQHTHTHFKQDDAESKTCHQRFPIYKLIHNTNLIFKLMKTGASPLDNASVGKKDL
jgi:hypothetical protein